MALVSPYASFPKDRRKIGKLRDRFELGRTTEELLSPYERKLVLEWSRCRTLGVDPALRRAATLPTEEYQSALARSSFILEKSQPILSKASSLLTGVPGILILTDDKGTILHVVGDPAVRLKAAEDSGLVEGACWHESVAGTNGIGTAITQKEAVHVFSNEHFCQGWSQWSCAATPILDPFTEEVLGVVDFTTFDKDYREDALVLTYLISGQIKAELRLQLELERMQLIHVFSDYTSRYPSDEIIVLDRVGRVVRSSPEIGEAVQRNQIEMDQPKKLQRIYLTGTDREIGSLLVLQRHGSSVISLPGGASNTGCVASFGEFVTASDNLKQIMERVAKVVPSDINVLLIGETGTGKEIIANYIHTHSKRQGGPFVAVNCGAISKELFKSEFFGYERGAFTGADPRGRKGVFECANGGTLFLDELGEMPLDIQASLLRVLETGRFSHVGSDRELSTNCRIIAATNRSLTDEIERGTFRADLYYRLGVAKFDIPPLRERPEDISVLVRHTLASLCRKHRVKQPEVTPEAMELLKGYHWPGNGREVRNVIESTMICSGDCITPEDLPANVRYPQKQQETLPHGSKNQTGTPGSNARNNLNVAQRELTLIVDTLKKYRDIARTCEALGVSRATFYRKCKAHGLSPSDYT